MVPLLPLVENSLKKNCKSLAGTEARGYGDAKAVNVGHFSALSLQGLSTNWFWKTQKQQNLVKKKNTNPLSLLITQCFPVLKRFAFRTAFTSCDVDLTSGSKYFTYHFLMDMTVSHGSYRSDSKGPCHDIHKVLYWLYWHQVNGLATCQG